MVTPKQKSALKKWSFTPFLLHFIISKRIKPEKCDCTHLEALFKYLKTIKDYLLFNKEVMNLHSIKKSIHFICPSLYDHTLVHF